MEMFVVNTIFLFLNKRYNDTREMYIGLKIRKFLTKSLLFWLSSFPEEFIYLFGLLNYKCLRIEQNN